ISLFVIKALSFFFIIFFFFSSRRRHTSFSRDWSSDVCSSDLGAVLPRRPSSRRLPFPGRRLRAPSLRRALRPYPLRQGNPQARQPLPRLAHRAIKGKDGS